MLTVRAAIVAVPRPTPSPPPCPAENLTGIQDVLDYLAGRYSAWSPNGNQEIDWCFLVEDRNGKSEALRTLATMLGVQPASKKLQVSRFRRAVPDYPREHILAIRSRCRVHQ